MSVTTWFVYIVKAKDNSYYTGVTTNLNKRVEKHNNKQGAKSLLGKIPVKLVYQENVKNKSAALKRESEIKSWPRSKKIELVTAQ